MIALCKSSFSLYLFCHVPNVNNNKMQGSQEVLVTKTQSEQRSSLPCSFLQFPYPSSSKSSGMMGRPFIRQHFSNHGRHLAGGCLCDSFLHRLILQPPPERVCRPETCLACPFESAISKKMSVNHVCT